MRLMSWRGKKKVCWQSFLTHSIRLTRGGGREGSNPRRQSPNATRPEPVQGTHTHTDMWGNTQTLKHKERHVSRGNMVTLIKAGQTVSLEGKEQRQ